MRPVNSRLFCFRPGIASDGLKGRVFEVSLADLQNDEVAFRKFKLITEDVQGKNCLTNFHGMDLTRDKMCSMVKKWQVMCILRLLYALTFCMLHCRKERTWVDCLLERCISLVFFFNLNVWNCMSMLSCWFYFASNVMVWV